MKSSAERTIEALTWASVVIWLGFTLIMHLLDYVWLVVMVLSIILLSSAIYQRSRGWHTSLSMWVFGVWMAVFSVLEVVSEMMTSVDGEGLQIDLWVYLGIALISMGIAVVLRNLQAPTAMSRGTNVDAAGSRSAYNNSHAQRNRFPQQIQEDFSSGIVEPPTSRSSVSSTSHFTQQIPRTDSRAQRAKPVNRRRARPVEEPQDLESRIDDIIQRSRERRDRDNLPY